MSAVESGNEHLIGILLEAKADVNLRNFKGQTVMHHAAILGHAKIIEELAKQKWGCSVSTLDRLGRTPLMLACMGSQLEAVRMLLNVDTG